MFNVKFGDKVLSRVAEVLRKAAKYRCVIGHVYAERFVVLVQDATDEELDQMCNNIESRISDIAQVDGTQCTIYALASFTRYSEHNDIEAMKRKNRDARLARQNKWSSESSESDVITSSLL
jgi:GGDEF domain-containing protein